MTPLQRRYALFLGGCIPLRLLLVYLAYTLSPQMLKYMGYVAVLPAIGFMYLYLTGSRKTGAETGGAPIWWDALRPIHAAFYLAFAYLAISGDKKHAWMVLAADVSFGLVAFMWKHFA